MPPRVLIVDDHEVTRMAVRALLSEHSFEVCGEGKDGKEAIEKVVELHPDIVLLDISMGTMNGLVAAEEIKRIAPATKIVFLTLNDGPGFVKVARAWAHGFVSKCDAGTKLIPALNQIAELNSDPYPAPIGNFEYPWQQIVADALRASTKERPYKMNAAQRAISERLVEISPAETVELRALREALRVLRVLLNEQRPAMQEFNQDEEIA